MNTPLGDLQRGRGSQEDTTKMNQELRTCQLGSSPHVPVPHQCPVLRGKGRLPGTLRLGRGKG